MQTAARPIRPLTFLAESLLATLIPSACRFCAEPLQNFSRLPVCLDCLDAVLPIHCRTCRTCGERVEETSAFEDCPLCRRVKSSFDRAVAFTSFEGEARELVHLLKYDGVRPAARPLGSMLARAILKLRDELSGASRPVLLVPVPLHAARQRLRRFNQTDLIARVAVAELGRHFPEATLEYAPKVLVRKRDTPSQSGLSNHQRRANLRAVFAVTAPERLRDRAVVLVDDVFTTGATAEECSRSLKRAGAKDVYVATVARSFKFSQAELDRWHFRTQSATHTGALPAQVAAHPKM